MLEPLKLLINSNKTIDNVRAYLIIISIIIMFLLLLWISIIDIKKQSITFWKMLVASSSTIICPIIVSFTCGCKYLKYFLILSLILWIFFLFINIKYNKDSFVGKADIDLLSAIVSICIMFSVWILVVADSNIAMIKITHLWYSFSLYLFVGAIFYVVLFLFIFLMKIIINKESLKQLIKNTKVSVIPMLMPVSIMIPYLIMSV